MRDKPLHLYRGTPAARTWSKHQRIDREWTLCGIPFGKDREFAATEDEQMATCTHCRDLAFDEYKESK